MTTSSLTVRTDRYVLSPRDIEHLVILHRRIEGWAQQIIKMVDWARIVAEPIMRMVEAMRQWQERIAVQLSEALRVTLPTMRIVLEQLPAIPPGQEVGPRVAVQPSGQILLPQLPANTYSPVTAEGSINGKDFYFSNPTYGQFFAHLVASGSMPREEALGYLGIKPNSAEATILLHESLKAIKKTTKLQGKLRCRGGRVYLKDTVQLKEFPKIP